MNFKLPRFSLVFFCFSLKRQFTFVKTYFLIKSKATCYDSLQCHYWRKWRHKKVFRKGREESSEGSKNSLTYLQPLSLNSQKRWEVPGASYNLRTPVTLNTIGLSPKLVSALLFNSKSYMRMTTWVDKQGFKTKPGFINPTKVLPPGLRQIIEELWLINVFTTGNLSLVMCWSPLESTVIFSGFLANQFSNTVIIKS